MKNTLLRAAAFLLVLCALLPAFCSCGDEKTDDGEAVKLSFKSAAGYDELKKLDGKQVTINGYLATSSPADGSFIFLMNLPYQSCPFCKPNTSQLSNTMEVYPKKNKKFGYTTQAVKVVGRLEVAPKNKSFTDPYGYEFNFKIVDADYTILSSEEMSADMALWQKIAESDVISEVYAMYDYVNFLCNWPEYFVNSYTAADGSVVPGYFLYAADAENFLYKDGAQYNYGYKDGYFDAIVAKIRRIDPNAFSDLVSNIGRAKLLAEKALGELKNGNYTHQKQYVEKFGTTDEVYKLNKGAELMAEFDEIYLEFANWLGAWEMLVKKANGFDAVCFFAPSFGTVFAGIYRRFGKSASKFTENFKLYAQTENLCYNGKKSVLTDCLHVWERASSVSVFVRRHLCGRRAHYPTFLHHNLNRKDLCNGQEILQRKPQKSLCNAPRKHGERTLERLRDQPFGG